jgi:hypothetical protein
MAKRKVPMRKCVVTGEMKPKKEMLRIVKTKEDEVFWDDTGKKNGRGAYVSLEPEVIKEAKEKDILSRALKTKVSDDFYDELLEHVNYRIARLEIMKQNEQ